jgi:hypothetical protein
VFLDGKLVAVRRGRRLRSVRIRGLPRHGAHTVRIVVIASGGVRRTTVHRYVAC